MIATPILNMWRHFDVKSENSMSYILSTECVYIEIKNDKTRKHLFEKFKIMYKNLLPINLLLLTSIH